MLRLRTALTVTALLLVPACGSDEDPTLDWADGSGALSAVLAGPDGQEHGTVEMAFSTDGASLTVNAGGHLADSGQVHGDHDGDLPSLLVRADGAALMVHAGPDNFANIPDRYAPQVDEATGKTGDTGGRVACAVLQEG